MTQISADDEGQGLLRRRRCIPKPGVAERTPGRRIAMGTRTLKGFDTAPRVKVAARGRVCNAFGVVRCDGEHAPRVRFATLGCGMQSLRDRGGGQLGAWPTWGQPFLRPRRYRLCGVGRPRFELTPSSAPLCENLRTPLSESVKEVQPGASRVARVAPGRPWPAEAFRTRLSRRPRVVYDLCLRHRLNFGSPREVLR